MEYRIHVKNGIKTSIIGINLTSWKNDKKFFDKVNFTDLILKAMNHKINFFSCSSDDSELLRSVYDLQKQYSKAFFYSILFGKPENTLFNNNSLELKKEVFENRFIEIEKKISALILEVGLTKINFFSLYYVKNKHTREIDINAIGNKLKRDGLIDSFGIYCQYISDALQLINLKDIDHLEIEIDINSSSEHLNSIFKIAVKKNISIICHQVENLYLGNQEAKNHVDPLLKLLDIGRTKFLSKFEQFEPYQNQILFNFALRKNLTENYQIICLNLSSFKEVGLINSCLNQPYLTTPELDLLQNAINPTIYDSPKHIN